MSRTWYFLCAQDSSYTWSDGWPVFFTHWGIGEPSNVASEGCVAMHGARFFHGTWNDTKCDLAKPYICKITTGREKKGPGQCPVECFCSAAGREAMTPQSTESGVTT